jgi:hypothetical protein
MSPAPIVRTVCALVVGCVVAAAAAGQAPPAPVLTRADMARFLETAPIVRAKGQSKGTTGVVRLTLRADGLEHDAAFSDVDEHVPIMRFASGRIELDFVDSYEFNIAAYRLAELLDLDEMMPVTVAREWNRRKGSLSWWLDAQMDEGQRLKRKIQPPDPTDWTRRKARMDVFAQLVADSDRNAGNILIARDWSLWMIDFTRAFRRWRKLPDDARLARCDRRLLEALRGLTAEAVLAKTRPYLREPEIEALLARRDQIVALFDKQIAERGEARVLY